MTNYGERIEFRGGFFQSHCNKCFENKLEVCLAGRVRKAFWAEGINHVQKSGTRSWLPLRLGLEWLQLPHPGSNESEC